MLGLGKYLSRIRLALWVEFQSCRQESQLWAKNTRRCQQRVLDGPPGVPFKTFSFSRRFREEDEKVGISSFKWFEKILLGVKTWKKNPRRKEQKAVFGLSGYSFFLDNTIV